MEETSDSNATKHEITTRLGRDLLEVGRVFGLNNTELAQVLGVTRSTFYNWLSGESKPRKGSTARLYKLWLISKAWHSSGFMTDADILHRPVIGDATLFDLLCEPELDEDRILFAGTRLVTFSERSVRLPDPFPLPSCRQQKSTGVCLCESAP